MTLIAGIIIFALGVVAGFVVRSDWKEDDWRKVRPLPGGNDFLPPYGGPSVQFVEPKEFQAKERFERAQTIDDMLQ